MEASQSAPSSCGRSQASVQSRATLSSTSTINKGPTMSDGVLFHRVKRCVLCLLTNTDANVIKTGPFGPASSVTLIWAKGTNAKPEKSLDKVCALAYQHGGFATEHPTPEEFAQARMSDAQLNSQWEQTYQRCIEVLEASQSSRTSKAVLADIDTALNLARQIAVDAYKRGQTTVRTKYRLILRSKYEIEHPGKIEREKMQCKSIFSAEYGKMVEVVMARLLPVDEWDMDVEDIKGVQLTEKVDDGSFALRVGQQEGKFKALKAGAMSSADIAGVTACVGDDASDNNSEESPAGALTGPGGSPEEDSDDDSGAVDALCSIFDEAPPAPVTVKASTKGKVNASSSSGQVHPSKVSVGKTEHRKGTPSLPSTIAQPVQPGRKFINKSVDEILGPHGWKTLCETYDNLAESFEAPAFQSVLRGQAIQSFDKHYIAVKKLAIAANSSVVKLDIKVRKWASPPDNAVAAIKDKRLKVKAMLDAILVFTTCNKSSQPNVMETARSALLACLLNPPLSFEHLFFKAKANNIIAFRFVSDFVGFVKEANNISDFTEDEKSNAREDAVEAGLQHMAGSCANDATGAMMDDFYNMVLLLIDPEGCGGVLQPQVVADLQDVSDAFSPGEKQERSLEALREFESSDAYNGILRPLFGTPGWKNILGKMASNSSTKSAKPLADLDRSYHENI